MDGHALFPWMARAHTVLIPHEPCHCTEMTDQRRYAGRVPSLNG